MRGAGHQFPVLQPSPGFPAVMPGAGIGMFPSTSVMGIPPAALSMPPGAASFPVQQPMYPMPIMQGGVVTGQPFMAPVMYGEPLANGFQSVQGLNGAARLSASHPGQQRPAPHSAVDEAKQRHFAEQQKRLQEFHTRSSGRKLDADSLIESIIGKSDKTHGSSSVKSSISSSNSVASPTVHTTTAMAVSSSDIDDSFGDFLSGVPSVQSASLPGVNVPQPVESSSLETAAAASTNVSNMGLHDPEKSETKDLQSMMLECSDLTAPKHARSFNKKPAVRDVHSAKTSSVTYSESRSARQWTADQNDELSELFSLPAPPVASNVPVVSQPPVTAQLSGQTERPARRNHLNSGSGSVSDSLWGFPLPRWVTGEIPLPELYHQVLQAVTSSEGTIVTDLVYPLLLRSNLPREVLGYIWELCNKTTPGLLIREELFLILAMISVAQNNMDYRSLAILSRCLQAPVPNLGQFDTCAGATSVNIAVVAVSPSAVAPVTATSPAAAIPAQLVGVFEASVNRGPVVHSNDACGPAGMSGMQGSSFADTPGDIASSALSQSQFHDSSMAPCIAAQAIPEKQLPLTQTVDGRQFLFQQFPASTTQSHGYDEDEFADFQAAPAGVAVKPVSHVQKPSPEADLFQADDDKYAVFRTIASDAEQSSVAVSLDQPMNNVLSGTSELEKDQNEYAEFAVFQSRPVVGYTPGAAAASEDTSVDVQRYSSGISQTSALPTQLSSTSVQAANHLPSPANVDKYQLIRQLVSDSSLFKPSPVTETDKTAKPQADAEDEWADFQSLPTTGESRVLGDTVGSHNRQTSAVDQDTSVFNFNLNRESVLPDAHNDGTSTLQFDSVLSGAEVDQEKHGTYPCFGSDNNFVSSETSGSEPWADFQSGCLNHMQNVPAQSSHPLPSFVSHFENDKAKPSDAPKADWLNPSKVSSVFAKQATVSRAGISTSYSSGALDFSPPELPPENDEKDEDDFVYCRAGSKQKDMHGVSSLSIIDFEEDTDDRTLKVETIVKSCGIGKMTESSSTSSFEFTGWKTSVSATADAMESRLKAADCLSTDSLELQPPQLVWGSGNRSRDESPSRDSRSESSLDFSAPPVSTVANNSNVRAGSCDAENKSVRSLELSEDHSAFGQGFQNGVDTPTSDHEPCNSIYSPQGTGWSIDQKSPSKPVNIKDLLDQGSLGMFGDRYSHLIHELQANDRHAYEWERCLEQCRSLLIQVEESFSSVSSSAICHELEMVEQGADFLSAISNARLGLLVRDVETTWNNLAAIFTKTPYMASCLTFDLTPAVLKTDDYSSRNRACGLCLLDIDWESKSKLSYGGRFYHSACANFWINFVDLTLPSLTVPELL